MAEQQQQEPSKRRISTSAAIASGIAATALVAGGGTGIWAWNKLTSSEPPPAPAPQEAAPPATGSSPAATAPEATPEAAAPNSPAAPATAAPEQVAAAEAGAIAAAPQAYWLSASGEAVELVPVEVNVNAKADAQAALETALERLLAGPRDEAHTTEIPQGTRLLKVSVREDGVHVDLSNDFTRGGGTLSMTGRVAQVLHTATSLNPDAPVWLNVDGEPLEVLGGEGLILDWPLTRRGFANDFGDFGL